MSHWSTWELPFDINKKKNSLSVEDLRTRKLKLTNEFKLKSIIIASAIGYYVSRSLFRTIGLSGVSCSASQFNFCFESVSQLQAQQRARASTLVKLYQWTRTLKGHFHRRCRSKGSVSMGFNSWRRSDRLSYFLTLSLIAPQIVK